MDLEALRFCPIMPKNLPTLVLKIGPQTKAQILLKATSHTRDVGPVTMHFKHSLVEKVELVQVRFILDLRD